MDIIYPHKAGFEPTQDFTATSVKLIIEAAVGPSTANMAKIMSMLDKALKKAKTLRVILPDLDHSSREPGWFGSWAYPHIKIDDLLQADEENRLFVKCANEVLGLSNLRVKLSVSQNGTTNYAGQDDIRLGGYSGSTNADSARVVVNIPRLLGFEGIQKTWSHLSSVVAHELVHQKQYTSARRHGSIKGFLSTQARQLDNDYPRLKNRSGYDENKVELMAFAKTYVQKLSADGVSKKRIIDLIKSGSALDFRNLATSGFISPESRRRMIKYAVAYAQQLPR